MPRLSVLLPVHNGGQQLIRAVSSTLRALPADAELIVVDDGSTDGTAAVLDHFAQSDPRLRVVVNPTPQGVAAALNRAIAVSDSAFLARMDADDVCLPHRFGAQLMALDDVDLVFGSSILIDARGRITGISTPLPVRPPAARYHLLVGNFFSHPTMACRRSSIDVLGGYRDTLVEDYDLWLRASAAGLALRQLSRPVLGYRMHAGQITGSWRPPAEDAVLDEPFRRLLPASLQDDAAVLRHSAVTRRRETAGSVDAWRRLRAWLVGRAGTLGTVDRLVLLRRIAQHAPRADAVAPAVRPR